ncbi:hypothetical protein EON67_06975 [archaeon]|nr:MAG: hypothetical protein EON67_06975 [archaeon]
MQRLMSTEVDRLTGLNELLDQDAAELEEARREHAAYDAVIRQARSLVQRYKVCTARGPHRACCMCACSLTCRVPRSVACCMHASGCPRDHLLTCSGRIAVIGGWCAPPSVSCLPCAHTSCCAA